MSRNDMNADLSLAVVLSRVADTSTVEEFTEIDSEITVLFEVLTRDVDSCTAGKKST